jgi:hypothetical protein
MSTKELKELHELLEQQKKEVAQSPKAAQELLEQLGIIHLLTPKQEKK